MMSASIFTFDHDPPRVSSPWSTPPGAKTRQGIPQDPASHPSRTTDEGDQRCTPTSATGPSNINYSAITKLDAEPQEGPTEYKLHLLLRQRRSFVRSTTGRSISGSLRRAETPPSSVSRTISECGPLSSTPPPLSSVQSRQQRLYQLTTQLLWRLQQSCPNHMPSSKALVLPHLADEAQLSVPTVPQQLIPGLEESKGALYEIGVADDGTFVGLADDEMEESLNNLRAMAASLGCCVDILRMVQVGECEWFENIALPGASQQQAKTGKLWVVEALVRPGPHLVDPKGPKHAPEDSKSPPGLPSDELSHSTQQLRVSLTGATRSGKSSLLGCLSTATLDNGQGKSRLSLLKHRHEIASGMTSSVTQELIGYRDIIGQEGTRASAQVISYGTENVSSWIDIHAAAEGGRLAFLSDSAGHPRFRRTTVRGLIGWDPHWTLLCIPADSTQDLSGRVVASSSAHEILGPAAGDVDLAHSHLQLCLNLELPLVVVITKYDLATKPGLRGTLSKLLSAIKDAGRKPCIVRTAPDATSEGELNTVPVNNLMEADSIVDMLETSPLAAVPIILTSSVKGIGIVKVHAFLRQLPAPVPAEPPLEAPRTLFYVEDIYSNIAAPTRDVSPTSPPSGYARSVVIGGHVRYGTLRIGQELLLGPYPADSGSDDSDSGSGRGSSPRNRFHRNTQAPTSCSFPGALRKGPLASRSGSALSGNDRHSEWRRVRITSIRNLRLPVRCLQAGQVGTIAVAPIDLPIASPALVRIRKGMVLADGEGEPKANRVIAVRFEGDNARAVVSWGLGTAVVVYVASARASAKVLAVEKSAGDADYRGPDDDANDNDDAAFGFSGFDGDDNGHAVDPPSPLTARPQTTSTLVTFQFIATREFVERHAKVLVLPGGGPGLYAGTERGEKGVAALEGFVGCVVEGY